MSNACTAWGVGSSARSICLAAMAALAGCGGGGSGGGENDTGARPASGGPVAEVPDGTSAYDVAAQVNAIRQHAGYGSAFRDGTNADAPEGLALPAPPRPDCMANQVTVASLAQFNAEAAGSCKRITLAPSATPYAGVVFITGQDIEAVLTGTTVTPTDDAPALQIVGDARRVKTIGGQFNNLYSIGGRRRSPASGLSVINYVQDVHVYGASFTGLYTQGLMSTWLGDGGAVSAHRLLIERSAIRTANGAFFIEGGSNLILANCNVVVPKLARHENPVRNNGGDLVAILDSRLRTELGPGQSGAVKHTWRAHASYDGSGAAGGRMIVRNVQSEGGGAMAQYPGVEGPHRQSSLLVVQGWRYYRAPEVEGNNVASFPYLNTIAGSAYLHTVMNAALWMDDNLVYLDGPTAGASFMSGGNIPPGSITNSVYAAYASPPVWTFR